MLMFFCLAISELILVCSICKAEVLGQDTLNNTQCTNGTFYSRDYKSCIRCSTCDVYSTMYSPCNATSDAVCVKCADKSLPNILDHPACQRCPPCQNGEYMETMCSDNTSTVCHPCPDGSFNYLASYRTHCFPCTSCVNRVTTKNCTTIYNTECGPCMKVCMFFAHIITLWFRDNPSCLSGTVIKTCVLRYFKDQNRNKCYRCASCAPGQDVIEECKNGRPGKLCSEYYFIHTDYINIPVKDAIDTSTTLQIITQTTIVSTSSSSQIISLEESRLTTADVFVLVSVIIPMVVLAIIIVRYAYKLKTSFKKLRIGSDSNDETILYLKDSYCDTDELIDNQIINETLIKFKKGRKS